MALKRRERRTQELDWCIAASIAETNGEHHPETGWYGTLVYGGIESFQRARHVKNLLYLAARTYRAPNRGYVSLITKVRRVGKGGYEVEYTVVDKAYAQKWVRENYTDETLPYDKKTQRHKPAMTETDVA